MGNGSWDRKVNGWFRERKVKQCTKLHIWSKGTKGKVIKNKVHLKYVGDTEEWRKYSGFMVFGTGRLKQGKSGE